MGHPGSPVSAPGFVTLSWIPVSSTMTQTQTQPQTQHPRGTHARIWLNPNLNLNPEGLHRPSLNPILDLNVNPNSNFIFKSEP